MKHEEELIRVKVGNLKKSALNYMVAKALGYTPNIVRNNEYKHTVRVDGPSSNPDIKFEMGKLPMQDSFDIYSNPTLVGEFLFNKLYRYIGIEIRDNTSDKVTAKAYKASNIVPKSIIEKLAFGDTPVEAGFKLLIMDYLDLPTSTCMVDIPRYLADQSGLLIEQDDLMNPKMDEKMKGGE